MRRFPKTLLYICVIGCLVLCFYALYLLEEKSLAFITPMGMSIAALCGVDRWREKPE